MGNSNKKSKIIIVGLDNSGKSTMINHLKPKKYMVEEIAATVGFKVESFSKSKIDFTCFDMSGQGKYRSLWEKYYRECEAVIFVVDAADELRFGVARNELDLLLEHDDISNRSVPILFFSNKTDLPQAHSQQEIAQALELTNITDRPWTIQNCSAKEGFGVEDGINWLSEQVKKK